MSTLVLAQSKPLRASLLREEETAPPRAKVVYRAVHTRPPEVEEQPDRCSTGAPREEAARPPVREAATPAKAETRPVREAAKPKAPERGESARQTPAQEKELSAEATAAEAENDIQFGVKFRGYNRDEVDQYLNAITDDYNAICKKNEVLAKENAALRQGIILLMEMLPDND